MDLTTIAENILSLIGLIALGLWLAKWIKGIFERQKDLSEIDKEIKIALRDSIGIQKDLHNLEKQKLQKELEDLSNQLSNFSQKLSKEKEVVQSISKSLELGSKLAIKIHENLVLREVEETIKSCTQILGLLGSHGLIDKELVAQVLSNKKTDSDLGSSIGHDIAILVGKIFYRSGLTMGGTKAMTLTIPSAISYSLQNPGAKSEEIAAAVAAAIRSHKLPETGSDKV